MQMLGANMAMQSLAESEPSRCLSGDNYPMFGIARAFGHDWPCTLQGSTVEKRAMITYDKDGAWLNSDLVEE